MAAEIVIEQGDITRVTADAIVNAANSNLAHGGGVAAAIVRRGGTIIQEESDAIGYVPVGDVAVTTAGNLPARWIIHAVGPRMGEGNEEMKLRRATEAALRKANELGATSIALPAISTGIFGFPVGRCAPIMLSAARRVSGEGGSLKRIVFCLYDDATRNVFERARRELGS